ncbi:MAG: hypothetical protein ACREI8_03065 [Myxococcota bacterium]
MSGAGFGASCTPDAGDHFVIGADAVVRVVGDLEFAPQAVGTGIEVASGGSLVVNVADRAIRIAVGSRGLVCQAGSTCEFRNSYRGYGPLAGRALKSPDPRYHFEVGEIVPCAGDCTATPHLVAFRYGTSDERASLLAVRPGEVMCFFDPDETDVWVSPDSGYCYEIAAVRTDAPPFEIVFDVRQGQDDPAGWPLARREIKIANTAAALAAGTRTVPLEPSVAIGADGEHVARWLRFGSSDSAGFQDFAYKIQATIDGDPDTVLVGDLRGLRTGSPDPGTPVAIDYGWRRGDAFFVSVPVLLTSATSARQDSPFRILGSLLARGLILDHLAKPTIDFGADVVLHQDVWIRDATSSGSGVSLSLTGRQGERFHRTLITGGIEGSDCAPHGTPPSTLCDTMHGIQVQCSTGVEIDGYNSRHLGDDHFVADHAACPGAPTQVIGRNWHCSFMGGNGRSAGLMSPQRATLTESSFENLVADDCVTPDSAALSEIGSATPEEIRVDNSVFWGLRGGGGGGDFTAHYYDVANLTAIGIDSKQNIAIMPNRVRGFVVRESRNSGSGANSILSVGRLQLSDGLVRDVELSASNFQAFRGTDGSSVENVALLDVFPRSSCANGCAFLAPYPGLPFATWTLRDVLLGYTQPTGAAQSGIRFFVAGPGPGVILSRLWLVNFSAATPAIPAIAVPPGFAVGSGAPTFESPFCFFQNGWDVPADFEADSGVELLRDLDPNFSPGPGGSVEIPLSSLEGPCGLRSPAGITAQNWALSKSGLLPEALGGETPSDAGCSDGIDGDRDGLPDFPSDPGCASAEDESEQDAALACDDGVDNDGDGRVDLVDFGCATSASPVEDPACDDGVDNDSDGLVDFTADPNCVQPFQDREDPPPAPPGCGLGFEILPILLAWRWRRSTRPARPRRRPTRKPRAIASQ